MPDFRIPFIKNQKLIANGTNAGLDITVADPAMGALIAVSPFPHQKLSLVDIRASAAGSTDLAFSADRGTVGFKGSGNAKALMMVVPDPTDATTAVGLDEDLPIALDLPGNASTHYVLLRWGIDASASVNGKVALGAGGAVTFGADGSTESLSAVLRRFNDGAEIGVKELDDTAGSWMLPSQVKGLNDIDPGTWIIAEVEGTLGGKLGVEYGLNYNWVKAAKVAGLSGDIGLKVQLGISATLGFSLAGKYAVIVSRESLVATEEKVRLRIFKLSKHGFDFALDAGVTAQADFTKLLPANADDFLKAVLGVHSAQVFKMLNQLSSWANSDQTLGGLFAQVGNEYVQQLVKHTTGKDPATDFTEAKARLTKLTDAWNKLDSKTASLVTKFVEKNDDLTQVKQAASLISTGDSAGLLALVTDKLPVSGFLNTPLGEYLEVAAAGGILSLLDQTAIAAEAKQGASAVLGVLDGSVVETMVKNLQSRITETLGISGVIDKVETLSKTDYDSFDKLLQAKLAGLIDTELGDVGAKEVEIVRKTVKMILDNRQKFYEKALDALNHEYKFAVSAAYEASTTQTALLDVEFDFAVTDFSSALQSAIDGKFDQVSVSGRTIDLLMDTIRGIAINKAALTHGISRHSHIEFHMPYFYSASDHVNQSNATFSVGRDGSRLLVGKSSDRTSDVDEFRSNRDRRDSTLGVVVTFPVDAPGDIVVHDMANMDMSYQFRHAANKMTPAGLRLETRPYTQAYFANLFGNGSERGSFDTFIDGINAATTHLAGSGIANIGDTLISLDVNVLPEVASAWFAPSVSAAEEDDKRTVMSIQIQMAMRKLVPFCVFQDIGNYQPNAAVSALIVYASLPPMVNPDHAKFDFFFPFEAPRERAALVRRRDTQTALQRNLQAIAVLLSSFPKLGDTAEFFAPIDKNITRLKREATGVGDGDLFSLLQTESACISRAVAAREDLLTAQASFGTNRAAAIKRLADFSAEFTEAFNKNVTSIYKTASLRTLGTLVFLQTCMGLQPETFAASILPDPFAVNASIPPLASTKVRALLDITVLKPNSTFNFDSFFNGEDPKREDALVQSRLANLLAKPADPTKAAALAAGDRR